MKINFGMPVSLGSVTMQAIMETGFFLDISIGTGHRQVVFFRNVRKS